MSLDRRASGFEPVVNADGSGMWRRVGAGRRASGKGDDGGFVVLGRDVERSVLTGRTADEVMEDAGAEGFVGRKGWRAVVE